MAAILRPNERYALVGKTRSGKTALAMVMAGTFAIALGAPWEVWWIDTKRDPKDLAALRKWGFRNAVSDQDRQTSNIKNALYFIIESKDKNGHPLSVVDQVQAYLARAYERKHVIVVIDEYFQAVVSKRTAGAALLDVFQRGGGRNVGIIGLTQEPVDIPRQLLSQATHLILLSLTYQHDIDYIHKMVPEYQNPLSLKDERGKPLSYGFYWKWVDGDGEVTFYPNQAVWYQGLMVAMPKQEGGQVITIQQGG